MSIFAYLVVLVISSAISYAMMPKPPAAQPPAELKDFDLPTAEEGRPIPVVFGTVKITGPNVLWYGDLYVLPVEKRV